MMITDWPFDPGLQPERTLLAWRRTALAIAAAGVTASWLMLNQLHEFAVAAGALGLGLSLFAYLIASRRYRQVHAALHATERLPERGAWPQLALALSVAVLAAASVVYVLALRFGDAR